MLVVLILIFYIIFIKWWYTSTYLALVVSKITTWVMSIQALQMIQGEWIPFHPLGLKTKRITIMFKKYGKNCSHYFCVYFSSFCVVYNITVLFRSLFCLIYAATKTWWIQLGRQGMVVVEKREQVYVWFQEYARNFIKKSTCISAKVLYMQG